MKQAKLWEDFDWVVWKLEAQDRQQLAGEDPRRGVHLASLRSRNRDGPTGPSEVDGSGRNGATALLCSPVSAHFSNLPSACGRGPVPRLPMARLDTLDDALLS